MDYYGLLFLYYLKGLSGKSVLRLFFNIEAGGTEQLLPENTSTPTTSPILADIQYPDGLRADQFFTYRETPTTVSNKARIKTIKGNTLVWNQLISDMNKTGTGTGDIVQSGVFSAISGHKYLIIVNGTGNKSYRLRDSVNSYTGAFYTNPFIWASTLTTSTIRVQNTTTSGESYNYYFNAFDLTAMGLDSITSADEFTSLFPLSYYSYNQGSLLSFMGNGIKTTGKNLFDENLISQTSTVRYSNIYVGNGTFRLETTCPYVQQANLFLLSGSVSSGASSIENGVWLDHAREVVSIDGYVTVASRNAGGVNPKDYQTILFNSNASDKTYEPYTTQTTNLPVATYFPTGMASAKNAYNNTIVYDELTPSKAIKRLEQYTFTGNETISGITNLGTYNRCYVALPIPSKGVYATRWEKNVPNVYNYTEDSSHYYVQNSQFWYFTTSSTVEAIRNELSGTKFYYDLSTPTETPITTEDANEALSLLMGKSVSSSNAKQMIDIITKGE